MSNVIYIDANRANSFNQQGNTNEFTYKLNTELELPKGTQIQIQNTFINLKGITGGSMEITEDITETYSYFMYITEQAQFAPLGHFVDFNQSWYRSTLGVGISNFYGNFSTPATSEAVKGIFYGKEADIDFFKHNASFFEAAGGSNQILPQIQWVPHTIGEHTNMRPIPKLRQGYIHIPKGIYGIGQIGQMIQDQFNGIITYDINTNSLIYKDDNKIREQDDILEGTSNVYDGQPYNRPFQASCNVERRGYDSSYNMPSLIEPGATEPAVNWMEGFVNMEYFNDLMTFNKKFGTTTNPTTEGALDENINNFVWTNINGQTSPPVAGASIVPMYYFVENFVPVAQQYADIAGTDFVMTKDPDETAIDYSLYPYQPKTSTLYPSLARKSTRIIGTSNFSFKYDEEKSAFSINGLHNAMRSPSHDRFGGKVSSSGQTVINIKKISRDFLNHTDLNGNIEQLKLKQKLTGVLNKSETRDGGIMIHNFALNTAIKLGNKDMSTAYATNDRHTNNEIFTFEDFFLSRKDAEKAWDTTIWSRMGFSYDDISNPSKFDKQTIYNRGYYPNYGFTTDVVVDETIPATISTLNNPLEFTPAGAAKTADKVAGLQMYNLNRMAVPGVAYDSKQTVVNQGAYAGGLYNCCSVAPVIIADVGGVIARRLPTLSTNAYFLITSDICDNYKDNVKKGDVLPLLGVVPKSSLSNQDFIVGENQIVQVLSQTKVINKIHIKILNPDLTAPQLNDFSSVILKITLPFKTPEALLQQEAPKIYQQITGGMQTF